MGKVIVQINAKQLITEVFATRGVEWKLRGIAAAIAADARSRAPVDTGEYRASIHTDYRKGGVRPHARAVADDWKAGLIEHYYRVLGHAADAGRR